MQKAIGIDPATKCGCAWRDKSGAWKTRTVKIVDAIAIASIIEESKTDGVTFACVEDVYAGRDEEGKLLWNAVKYLCESQGRILAACERADLPVVRVLPCTWQTLLAFRGARPRGRDSIKARSIEVSRRFGAMPANDHEADACCIAEFASHSGAQLEFHR